MSRRGALVVLAALTLAPSTAAGGESGPADSAATADQAVPPPTGTPPAAIPPTSKEFYTPPWGEMWLRLLSRVDIWEGPHVAAGVAAGMSFDLTDQRRCLLGFNTQILVGTWGDNEERGKLIFEHGPELRFSPYMDELLDVFILARTLGVLGVVDGVHWGIRPGIGVGARAARHFAIELAYEPVWPLGQPLVDDGEAVTDGSPSHGLSLDIGVDACLFWGGCAQERDEPKPQHKTEELYDLAHELHCAMKAAERKPFCTGAVEPALDAAQLPASQPADRSGVEVFLRAVLEGAAPTLHSQLWTILNRHLYLRAERSLDQTFATQYARTGEKLRAPVEYEPIVIELRYHFGCDDDDPPECKTEQGAGSAP
ncbi:MAG: hypothetical protein JRI68_27665 [Deltaproteobacteria bacterium]|nr:hypothetical protein [Deltaproteobacteria bacterium]